MVAMERRRIIVQISLESDLVELNMLERTKCSRGPSECSDQPQLALAQGGVVTEFRLPRQIETTLCLPLYFDQRVPCQ